MHYRVIDINRRKPDIVYRFRLVIVPKDMTLDKFVEVLRKVVDEMHREYIDLVIRAWKDEIAARELAQELVDVKITLRAKLAMHEIKFRQLVVEAWRIRDELYYVVAEMLVEDFYDVFVETDKLTKRRIVKLLKEHILKHMLEEDKQKAYIKGVDPEYDQYLTLVKLALAEFTPYRQFVRTVKVS